MDVPFKIYRKRIRKQLSHYSASIWSGVLLMIRVFVSFMMQKIVAISFGPTGTTLFSHFQNFVSLFTQPIQDTVVNGVINAFSKKSLRRDQVLGAAILVVLILVVTSLSLLVCVGGFRESLFSFGLIEWILVLGSLLLFCFSFILLAVYIAQKKMKQYVLLFLTQWVFFYIILWFSNFSLNQFLVFWLVFQGAFSVIILVPVYPFFSFDFVIKKEVKRHFSHFGMMAVTVWVSSKWVDFFVRGYAVQQFGSIDTGLWQAVERISYSYRGLLISFLFLSFYPMISDKLAKGLVEIQVLKKYYVKYALLSFVFLAVLFNADELILKWLYDLQYMKAAKLFQLQIIGDLFAFLAFPFTVYIIAAVKTKAYMFTELLSSLLFVALISLEVFDGIEGLIYAHIVRFVCYGWSVTYVGIKDLYHAC